jgi:RNA-binding protein YlmH
MKNLQSYIDSLSSEERIIAKKIIDLIKNVKENYRVRVSDFLSYNELFIAESILNFFNDTSYYITGISKNAHRKVVIICPYEIDLNEIIQSYLSILRVEIEGALIEHKDVLGSLMSLGITRSKIGDIFVGDLNTNIIIKKEAEQFLLMNFDKIGKKNIKVNTIDVLNGTDFDYKHMKIEIIVSSLRIDSVISALANVSRGKAIDLIESKSVKINGVEDFKKNILIKKNDVFSIRGLGKYKLGEEKGITKKNNIVVFVYKYI